MMGTDLSIARRKKALVVVSINGNNGQVSDFKNFEESLFRQFKDACDPTHRLRAEDYPVTGNTKTRTTERTRTNVKTIGQVLHTPAASLFSLRSSTSQILNTSDGIQRMAERAAVEVVKWIQDEVFNALGHDNEKPWDVYFSVVGHSLGGLIARYLIYLLFHPSAPTATSLIPLREKHATLMTLHPLTYMSVGTPHVGSRRSAKPGSWTAPVFQGVVDLYLKNLGGQTGRELFLNDSSTPTSSSASLESSSSRKDEDTPLLMRMADPSSPFIETLRTFKPILIASVRDDLPVGYCSAAVASINPHVNQVTAGAGEVGDLLNNDNPSNDGRARLRILSASGFFVEDDAKADAAINPELCRPIPPPPSSTSDSKDEKAFWLQHFFHAATEVGISAGTSTQEIVWPRGTLHHLGEAFHSVAGSPSNGNNLPDPNSPGANGIDKNDIPLPTKMHFIPDANHDNLLPTQLLTTLQHTLGTLPTSKTPTVRRLNIDFVLASRLARTTVHALSVGKVEGEGLLRGVAATRGAWGRLISDVFNAREKSTPKDEEDLVKDMKSGTLLACGLQAGWMLARIVMTDFMWQLENESIDS
ncbi:putative serine esterase-domain-containing protein [Phlyctochytrium arcticum]|nr:putative serine esterase-domain-containing protein [Phlyctochytrium arcticum]